MVPDSVYDFDPHRRTCRSYSWRARACAVSARMKNLLIDDQVNTVSDSSVVKFSTSKLLDLEESIEILPDLDQ